MVNLPAKRNKDSWYPFSEIENLQREMNRLFNFNFPTVTSDSTLLAGQWAPTIDVIDTKDNIVIKADLPGLKKEDIDVSVQENILTIRGEKKQESEVKEQDYLRAERYCGSFVRSLILPTEVDSGKVNASFKDGVLELTLGKKEEAKPKQIKIDVK